MVTCADLTPRDRVPPAPAYSTTVTLAHDAFDAQDAQCRASEIIPAKRWIEMSFQMGLNMADNLFTRTATVYTEGSTANSSNPPVFVVCDVNRITADTFAQDIATRFPGVLVQVADSPSEVAQRADTIFTMLPSTPQVKDVYLGERGILQGVNKRSERVQSLYVDSTTLDVTAARDVAAQVEATGGDMVDAPVSGGVVGARAGTLSFMVGGSEKGFKRAHPFLSTWVETLSTAICNNLVLGVQQIVVAEAMLLGTRLGLSPDTLAGVKHIDWSMLVLRGEQSVPGALPGKSPPCEREFHGKSFTHTRMT
ncbi:3-hydroxyisobutyrate dehydrogenase [Rhizoctonia solani]|uniref:3-hydroxyisobutyrate dehydrogenase n=1 Tax=Rhizoctonia solani TaxID=456999 RepID=A0A8H7IBT2_9AGAM|nr:3-hydroxyisobutyrate dehydrogenase [Rhizoctonia solani]